MIEGKCDVVIHDYKSDKKEDLVKDNDDEYTNLKVSSDHKSVLGFEDTKVEEELLHMWDVEDKTEIDYDTLDLEDLTSLREDVSKLYFMSHKDN